MKRNNKKGFTIVELVIVIAVIAILAGVLIPTFSSIVRKANLSADQQAVRQMNLALATAEIEEEITSRNQVYAVLFEEGYDAENYKPLTANTRFVWIKSENRIVHLDENDVVLYPEDFVGKTFADSDIFNFDAIAGLFVVVNTVDELSSALKKDINIEVSANITEWVLTEDVIVSAETIIKFVDNILIKTNGFKLELQGGTISTTKTISLDGTITVGVGDSLINGLSAESKIVRTAGKIMLNCQTENSSLTVSAMTLDGGIEVTSSKTPIIMIRKGAVVNIKDNTTVENSISAKDGSAAFNVGLGTLNLDGATVKNNKLTAAKGGAIYIREGAVVNVKDTEVYGNIGNCGAFIGEDNYGNGCTVNIYSGNIYDNTSTDAGHSGVIYVRKTSVVNIYGGVFTNNSGIYSQDIGNATLNIFGGTFNNPNENFFGGNNSASIINIAGNPKITASGDTLVYANGNASGKTEDILFITGELTEGASIVLNEASVEHILSRTNGYIARGKDYTITEADVAKFKCEGYIFKLDSENNTIIVEKIDNNQQ